MSSKKLFWRLSLLIFILNLIILNWIVMLKCNNYEYVVPNYQYQSDMVFIERLTAFIVPFLSYFEEDYNALQLIGGDALNILIFIPTGMYLTMFVGKEQRSKVIFITFLISFFFEIAQLFSQLGWFSTLDLMTNTLGGMIGYYVCKTIYKEKWLKRLNVASAITASMALPLAIYAIVNTALNYQMYLDVLLRRI